MNTAQTNDRTAMLNALLHVNKHQTAINFPFALKLKRN